MNEVLGNILAFFWIFGGLMIWPWKRLVLEEGDKQLGWLKSIFFAHVIALFGSVMVIYQSYPSTEIWLRSLFLPYIVGSLSLITSLAVLLMFKFKKSDD